MISINGATLNICIINIYFGKLPNYFSLWLKTASFNKNIDFVVFTDDERHYALPKNVRILHMTLADLKNKIEEKIGFKVTLPNGYKCCDYKPIYGLIFDDFLEKYDYWGHCDLDLMWGDLEKTFIENSITNYDRFFYLGHLSLYKNTSSVNNYFKMSGATDDFVTVFTTDRICGFDEEMGMVKIYEHNCLPFFKQKLFADITPFHKRFQLSTHNICQSTINNYKNQLFYWDNGSVFRIFKRDKALYLEEFAYIHFQKRPNFLVEFDANANNTFAITKNGFIPINKPISLKEIKKLNPYNGILFETFEDLVKCLKIKARHFKTKIKYKLKKAKQ